MISRLANVPSAYLRSAKDQPVDWYPWGTEPFERARTEQKPVVLDIGAVWCHWCHVMDHESYEDPAIAEILNRDWICIKVDRDERPDIDARYQRAVQAFTGQGGWPLTGFLTPDGEVFYGGTYFPPDGKHGRPGFRSVLLQLADAYRTHRDKVLEQAAEITNHLTATRAESRPGTVSDAVLDGAADGMARLFDFRHGGFGAQPKFPHAAACEFLLARWFDTGEAWQADVVHRTLAGMARGGIRDHLGGGFHRYSVDARWIVPHFEKMSYDNSELLRVYIHAASALSTASSRGPDGRADYLLLYRDVVEGIARWVNEVMSDPEGGYFASQDADVGAGDDGDYFTWTPEEAAAVLDADEFAVVSRHYDIDVAGEMQHNPKKNVLWLKQTPAEIAAATAQSVDQVQQLLASAQRKLLDARRDRPTPFVDTARYTAWNALMASAMLDAGAFLGRTELEHHALRTLERMFQEATSPGLDHGMRHAPASGITGWLDDQVTSAQAALDAYEATGDSAWLDRAASLMEVVWREYRAESGGLLDTARHRGGEGFLTQPIVPVQDAPTPSPNGVAGIVLARLVELTGAAHWAARRDELLEALAGGAAELSVHGATLLRAIDWAVHPTTHVVVIGDPDDRVAAELLRVARWIYRPRKVVQRLALDAPRDTLPGPVRAMLDGGAPRAYVCSGAQCAAPVSTPGDLASTMATFAAGSSGRPRRA